MSSAIPLSDHHERAYLALQDRLPEAPPWVSVLRGGAFARLRELGFPSTRDEAWRYTNVRPIVDTDWGVEGGSVPSSAPVELPAFQGPRLTFVNGRYESKLSHAKELPQGVLLGSLAEALAGERRDELRHALASAPGWRDEAFASLNTASFEDGALLLLPEDCVLSQPVHLQFLSTPGASATGQQPRILIVSGERSDAHVVETWSGLGGASFTNVVTEVLLAAGATLEHVKLQHESRDASHLAWTAVRQQARSSYRSRLLSLGGGLTRNGLRVSLDGEGAECELNGLYVATERQHVDNQIHVHHRVPHTRSRQLYKSVLTGHSRGIFTGCVEVDKDAQKIVAHQQNRNLLLSDNAVADTRPQLEIHADDVRCTHGATIGRLDEGAVFYLRSRGLDLRTARSLLTQAFAMEILESLKEPMLAAELCQPVHRRLQELEE